MGEFIKSDLQLRCSECGWFPPEGTTMGVVEAHNESEHGTVNVMLELVPVCTCGEAMVLDATQPTGGGRRHYYHCVMDGNTTSVVQRDQK